MLIMFNRNNKYIENMNNKFFIFIGNSKKKLIYIELIQFL